MGLRSNLVPYPTYKPSGISWLGDVPENWQVRRLRDSTNYCVNGVWGNDPDGNDDLPCVRVADFDRHRLRVNRPIPTMRSVAPNERRRRMLRCGDLLLEKSGGGDQQPVGVVMLFDHEVSSVCSNFIARISVRQGFDSLFLTFLHSALYSIGLNTRSIKQTTGIQNLDSTGYLNESVAFPPLHEQRAIARYLDYMDRRIQRYIRAKERLIELLEEQKRAVINHAVTRGLDPDVPLKPSGVEWFADVPAHWEVRRLKFLYKQVDERSKTGDEELMSVSHITGVTPRKKNVNMFLAETNLGYKLCNPGDVVINTMWAFMAALGVARQIGLVSPSYAVYRPIVRGNLCDDYVEALLRIEAYKANYFIRSTGITSSRLRLYPDSFLDIPLINPPVEEQSSIAEYVGRATADTDSAIDRVRRQMELMSEYRTRLILDVVTGKLDVRDAVANLPDDLGDDELWEPSGDL